MAITIAITDEQIQQVLERRPAAPSEPRAGIGKPTLEALESTDAEIAKVRDRLAKLEMLSEQKLCGLFEINRATLIKLPIVRVVLKSGVVRYPLHEVEKFIQDRSTRVA